MGLIALVLAGGLVLAGCKEDDPCCTTGTFDAFVAAANADDGAGMAVAMANLPACCLEIMVALDQGSENLGCCADALSNIDW